MDSLNHSLSISPIHTLKNTNKELTVNFDVLTRENLLGVLKKGCIVLHLDFYQEEDDQFIFEATS